MKLRRTLLLVAVVWIAAARVVHAQCTYSLPTTAVSASSTGGNHTVSVITGAFCSWSSTSNADWITIVAGSGTGLGGATFAVAPNPTSQPRTGTLVVAGHTVTVTQQANSCVYTVAPLSFSVSGGRTTVTTFVTTGSTCSWVAAPSDDWIGVTAGATGSGRGSVTFEIGVNLSGAARTGTVVIGTKIVTIDQAAPTGTPPPAPTGVKIVQ
jgi:hypothetical protein